ncbi:hypothetical protein LEM8419_00001 [Neolewinella maritima]|uniref:DUF3578 domain-containing protein n=1 Tax=Neolewinella maritima TaxID=1383882 RepID=A0ABM9AWT7_9BACT|nr:DUF3578 domain-containing protein [Neolewinella maritima]CAH0998656.1 hypothetical protein LEM8419_00001 [Neolewinella maritima]
MATLPFFEEILYNYELSATQKFSGHWLAKNFRSVYPKVLHELIDFNDRYIVKGSSGKGNWTHCPWIAILDKVITVTPQKGYYPVFLFRRDMSGFYLSLNQGVTNVMAYHHLKASDVLRWRAEDFRKRLGELPKGFTTQEIELYGETSTVKNYEHGNICAKYYDINRNTSLSEVQIDLIEMLEMYEYLVYNDTTSTNQDEEKEFAEDPANLRLHFRIERNQKLVDEVKKVKGYTCQVCQFNFLEKYGELGKEFIEAHHLIPISELEGEKVLLDPDLDFSVLCSNCHRMIHRTENPSDIKALKEIIDYAANTAPTSLS